jgi:cytochrome c biogenesis DsbD-like protein
LHSTAPGTASEICVRDAVAFGAGEVSFLSPCVLPLVSAYLSLVIGLDVAEVTGTARGQVLRVSRDTAGREVRHKAETCGLAGSANPAFAHGRYQPTAARITTALVNE